MRAPSWMLLSGTSRLNARSRSSRSSNRTALRYLRTMLVSGPQDRSMHSSRIALFAAKSFTEDDLFCISYGLRPGDVARVADRQYGDRIEPRRHAENRPYLVGECRGIRLVRRHVDACQPAIRG